MQQISRSSDPFRDYDVVRDFSMFFGRKYELRAIYSSLTNHQNVALVGKRHIGKSSLLKYLGLPELQRLCQYDLSRYLFILTDWRDYLNKTRADFFQRVCEQIIQQSAPVLSLALASDMAGEDRLRHLLETIKEHGYYPVLLMDAFDHVTSNIEFGPQFFTFLRSLASVNELISYVTATRLPLSQVCHSAIATSPFFNIFMTCKVGPLAPDEARELVTVPASKAGVPFTEEEVAWLLERGGLHPFFLQVSARHLFEAKRLREPGAQRLKFVEHTIVQELQAHFDAIWQDMEDREQKQLISEIFQEKPSRFMHLELSSSLLFCRKMKAHTMSQHDPVEIFSDDIKIALDHLSDLEFLTHCKLVQLRSVSVQIEHGGKTPSNRSGWLVKEVLKKAFERMKPGDIRIDTALEWRSYNILWYRYFKYNLPNHNTAARLGISLRQFYRDQDKAIEALRKEVLALDEGTLLDE